MFIINYLLAAGLLASPGVMDEQGWVAVEKVQKKELIEMAGEIDPSIWVVFGKKIGSEKFLIRFPEEPTYRYMEEAGKEMEMVASGPGAQYRLQVLDQVFENRADLLQYREVAVGGATLVAQEGEGLSAELVYWKDGFWVFETLIGTKNRTYFLQTTAASVDDAMHHQFVASFDVETHF